ncbi:acetyl-CoA carboxylase biotin carboxylase subunit [Lactobacillus alvi]|uniref:biotin carboxylase n=1 Tax=Limosilactobacillus alvi TaxID=990412 RepID=A0ABS2EPV0_9LACO|nr:acetyl-CoA carboxylase biotin carboxylase subunit [Limosilactobacillus alvi]MBM6754430.1 acetyl-CoA carboxylase biotin carboxylase subunit [Limosilactobacillus alvi]
MDNHLFKSSSSISKWPFHKVLIANRGEIAVRIIRTCRVLGLQTVAVYSTADEQALHVQLADEAVCIGPANAEQSYLNISAIISAAQLTRAEAVHPGYGFLSESAEFAQACRQNHLKLIGPSPEVIKLLGDKETARLTMKKAGLPVVKGSQVAITTLAEAKQQADQIGYPVMLKASAGGGGKGMRIINSAGELKQQFATAQEEAVASFNDKRMYLEQYLPNPRHVEVQIIADQYGNAVALGERDCTIQARHQKVIEEAPAVILPANVREKMLRWSEQAVRQLNYEGVGTIEFLYNPDGSFYFMEMNTRIQVEHPITELITGTDLIEIQLRIAAGARLSNRRPQPFGFAMECRINALTPGKISALHLPVGQGVRIETALYQGYQVPTNYDGMIAKIIVYGDRRQRVLQQMQAVIDETVIGGIQTNLDQLEQILQEPDFQRLVTDVNWLDQKSAS